MDLGALRTLVRDLNVSAHGLDVTVTPLGQAAIATRGIWVLPQVEDHPVGSDLQRREPRKVLALKRDIVGVPPRGSVILAPEVVGGAIKTWRVDGIERVEAELTRLIVALKS